MPRHSRRWEKYRRFLLINKYENKHGHMIISIYFALKATPTNMASLWCQQHIRESLQPPHQYRVAGSVPRRSSTSLSRVVVSNSRIRVPFREAEAATLPGWFSARQAISLWWALMVKGAEDVPGLVFERSWVMKGRSGLTLLASYSQRFERSWISWENCLPL